MDYRLIPTCEAVAQFGLEAGPQVQIVRLSLSLD
jgi:hypothetical protein